MVEWFEDLALGMRFKGAEKLIMREDIKRFAAEFDRSLPDPPGSARGLGLTQD